jgi:peptidyl-prolyl cis-trans isomerase C
VPTSRRARIAAAVLLALLVVGSVTPIVATEVAALPADAAFRIGGGFAGIGATVTTADELEQRIAILGSLYGIRPPSGSAAATDQFDRGMAKSVAISDVISGEARTRHLVIPDKQADEELSALLNKSGITDRSTFAQKLGELGLSLPLVRTEVKRQLAASQLYAQVVGGVPAVADQQINQYFEANRTSVVRPERRQLRNIVVADENQANTIAERARSGSGSDFGQLARQYTQDQQARGNGGELGAVTRDQLSDTYGQAAFSAAPNTVFGPVRTSGGWNVGLVERADPATPLTLVQAHDQLRELLTDQARSRAWTTWLNDKLTHAHIEYADRYRPPTPLVQAS